MTRRSAGSGRTRSAGVISSEGPGVTNVEPVGFVWPDPAAVCVDVVTVPDPETVKYRAHLDLATTSAAHQAELVARLKELGATPADVGQGDVPWTVLADPEGNVFCVLEPRSRSTGTPGRSPRWSSTAPIRGPWPGSGARRRTGPCTR